MNHTPPLLVLEACGPSGEFPQNIRSGAATPFWVRVRRLHLLLVLALQAIPFLLRRFAVHVRQPLWQMPCWMPKPLFGLYGKLYLIQRQ
ncbi:MAG: hypothetical protein ABSD96_21440, partial [Candidatus Korobacteraceae bacterium]